MFKYGIDHLTAKKALQICDKELIAGLGNEAEAAVGTSHQRVLSINQSDQVTYGINTGFGPLCNTIIPADQTVRLQHNLLLSHSVGVGNPIDQRLSKLMLILKVHALAQGFSGISPEILYRIMWHIHEDVIPVVPEQGSVGASGDLAPLSHLFLPLLGEGKVHYNGEILPAAKVLKQLNKEPLKLHPKAGLALINGTQFILAHAVVLVDEMQKCLSHADIIGAMMVEGLLASSKPFHTRLHQTRPHKGAVHVAARISKFLSDSEIGGSHLNCSKVQDPYSLRCMPQVHGSSRSAWLHLKEAVEVELNSVTDNPLIFSSDFTISGGNFHGQPLALPIDYSSLALSELGNISDRRSYFSLEGKDDTTPKLLMKNLGVNSGFMIVQYTSAALASENKTLCFPASADSIPTSMGQEDHVSMGSIGARKALRICRNTERILAIELLCAAQAFDFRKPLKSSPEIEAVHQLVRNEISHAEKDRIFSDDINKAIKLLQSGQLIDSINELNESYSTYDEQFEAY